MCLPRFAARECSSCHSEPPLVFSAWLTLPVPLLFLLPSSSSSSFVTHYGKLQLYRARENSLRSLKVPIARLPQLPTSGRSHFTDRPPAFLPSSGDLEANPGYVISFINISVRIFKRQKNFFKARIPFCYQKMKTGNSPSWPTSTQHKGPLNGLCPGPGLGHALPPCRQSCPLSLHFSRLPRRSLDYVVSNLRARTRPLFLSPEPGLAERFALNKDLLE